MSLTDHIYARIPGSVGSFLRRRREKIKNRKPPETFVEHIVSWIRTIVWALSVVTIVNGLALASFTVPTGSMEDTVLPGEFLFVNKLVYGPSTPQIIPFVNVALPYYKTPPIFPPEQGDVIVFIFPGNRDEVKPLNFEYYLKRCVAVSGDVLEIRNRKVLVNGVEYALPEGGKYQSDTWTPEKRTLYEVNDTYRTFPVGRGYTRDNYGPIRIPKEGDVIKLESDSAWREWAVFIAREGHIVNAVTRTIDGSPATTYTVERDYVFGMGDNRDNSEDSRYWGFIPEEDVVGTPMIVYWSWEKDDAVRGVEYGFFDKIKRIRWSRLGTIIR